MLPLLQDAAVQGTQPEYVGEIMAAIKRKPSVPAQSSLVEPLSKRAIANSDGDYGFIFRRDENGNLCAFTIATVGKYSLTLYNQKTWSNLIGWTDSAAIKTGAATNHLKVITQGNPLALFVNDQPLNTFTDATLAKGPVGFYFSNGKPQSSVAFDNLVVSKINRPLALPAAKPTPARDTPDIPAGMGSLIVSNFYGNEINYEIGGKLYKIPGNGKQIIVLAPGKYTYSADIPGRGRAGGTIEIKLGVYITQPWADLAHPI